MSRQVQIRRGSATAHTNFTGAIGEITMDTTNKTLRVHDGITPGGTILAKQSEIPEIPPIPKFIPDFSNAIEITTTPYTCPSDGYLRLYAVYNGYIYYKSSLDIQLNDWTYNSVGASSRAAGNWFVVQQGETLTRIDISGSSKAFFYPLKNA